MALDWLNAPIEKSIGDLVARRRYSKAIEELRAQILSRTPTTQARLQLADLLVLAGRGQEAVPILFGLADEFAADGFAAKAVAVLKRIERIEPGRADVESRLSSLVRHPRPAASRRPELPEFGIEEIAEATSEAPGLASEGAPSEAAEPALAAEAPAAQAPVSEAPVPHAPAEEAPAAQTPEGLEMAPAAAAPPETAKEAPAPPGEIAVVAAEAAPEPQAEAVAEAAEPAPAAEKPHRKIRSVFRRFLASLGGGEEREAEEASAVPEEAAPERPAEAKTSPEESPAVELLAPAPAPTEAIAAPEAPAPGATVEPAAPVELTPPPAAVDERAAGAAEAAKATEAAEVEKAAEPEQAEEPPASESAKGAEPEPGAPLAPEKGVSGIRGVFRRFLTSIAGPSAEETESPPADGGVAEAASPEAEPVAVPVEPIEPEAVTGPETPPPAAEGERAGSAPEPPAAPEPTVREPAAPEPAAQDATATETEAAAAEEAAESTPPEPPVAQAVTPTPSTPAEEPTEPALEAETMSQEAFEEKVLDIIEGVLRQPQTEAEPPHAEVAVEAAPPASGDAILASPLFDDLSDDELLAVVHGLRLLTFDPGDMVVTEGEPGTSLFILSTGVVRVFVRNPAGRNLPVGVLQEGDFFGEISSLSGHPRTASVTATARCELLELEKSTVDSIARSHPRVREMLEAFYVARASSPEAAAIRAVPLADAQTKQHALQILQAHFGESRWDPRMRLRLAEVLLKAGKEQDAVPVLIGLADDLAREGFTEKAIAILKKIEKIQRMHMEEINLAPLRREKTGAAAGVPRPVAPPAPEPRAPQRPALPWAGGTEEFFQGWLVDILRERVRRAGPTAPLGEPAEASRLDPVRMTGYARGLRASPLFDECGEDELLALIQGLRLLTPGPGDIIVTEGEPGESLYVLASGAVKVFVRNPAGHNVALCTLREGSFFGEISTLSSRPRTATVTAAAPCELLELDKAALEAISAAHPRVRSVLEEFYIERAMSPDAARIRDAGGEPGAP